MLGIFTHWWILLIIIGLLVLLFVSPRALPGIGRRAGRKARETGEASVKAARNFKDEFSEPVDKPTKAKAEE
ncbi:MAG: hypothetical protein QOE92_273 [Chloroflexota bacterium]|jgi:Sec-independent protein translocase protein TatA|nr:hypothetical protein [Chloroflexota bacterium]